MIKLIGKELFQWNKGRQLKINNNSVNEAVFSNDNIKGLKVEIIDGIVDIPNIMLTKGVRLFVYVSITDDEKRETLYRKEFPIIPAAKPSDYIDEDINIDDSTLEKLENLIDLMYNGNVDEILVFTNEGPKWMSKDELDLNGSVDKEEIEKIVQDKIDESKEIYIGSDEPPESAQLQIDLEEEPFILDPIQATENMKAPVGIDAEGKLWADIDPINPPEGGLDEEAVIDIVGVTRIESTSENPIYFTEMQSGIYILKGIFRDYRGNNNIHEFEKDFFFDEETLVSLYVNPNAEDNQTVAQAMIYYHYISEPHIELYKIVRKINNDNDGYQAYSRSIICTDNFATYEYVIRYINDTLAKQLENYLNYNEMTIYVDTAINNALSSIGIAEEGAY